MNNNLQIHPQALANLGLLTRGQATRLLKAYGWFNWLEIMDLVDMAECRSDDSPWTPFTTFNSPFLIYEETLPKI